MIIYKYNGEQRAEIEVSQDAEESLKISDECSFTTKIELSYMVNFSPGDYVIVFGNKYHIDKPPKPAKKGTNNYSWTLKFVDARSYLANVDFFLSDGTTLLAYDEDTIYCYGAVCSSGSNIWRFIFDSPASGHDTTEISYWEEIPLWSSTRNNLKGDYVYLSDIVYLCLNANTGEALTDGDFWTIVNTAQESDFSIVLSPKDYAQMICDCMNAETTQHWIVGSCISETPKETSFSNVQCLDAAAAIADLFETEVYVDMNGTDYRINFIKQAYISSPQITFLQGEDNGLTDISVNENTETTRVTRLKAKGGTTNINTTYRNGSKRLLLPDVQYIDSLLRDPADPHNKTVTWDDIFPAITFGTNDYDESKKYYVGNQVLYNDKSYDCITETASPSGAWNASYWELSEGQVTEVLSTVTASTTKFTFSDTKLSFNPLNSAYLMADGTMPKVHFITGNMAGHDFPIIESEALTGGGFSLTIEQIQDSADSNMPTVGYMFEAGDMFYFIDLYMPQSYVTKAEKRLLAKAQEYLAKYERPQITYSCNVDIIKATNEALELHLGELVLLSDSDLSIVNEEYRIVELTRQYRKPYKYTIKLSNLPYEPTRITKIENATTQNETYIERCGLTSLMSQTKTFRGAKEAIDMAFDPSGNYFNEVIKPLVVETSLLLVGTNEQQYTLNDIAFSTLTSNVNYIGWTTGSIVDSSMQDTERTWYIASGSFTAVGDDTAYYCYIRAERAIGSSSASILFDSAQHLTKEGSTYYYFLVGTLGAKTNGFRQFYTSYGFTFVSGNSIYTGCIRNTDGSVVIDLSNKKVYFGTTDASSYVSLDTNARNVKLKDIILVSSSGDESVIGVFRGEYYSNTIYYEGDQVTYDGGYWRCKTQCIGQSPQENVYWTVISAAGESTKVIYCENQNLSVTPSVNAFTKAVTIHLLSGGVPIPVSSWTSKTKTLTGLTAGTDTTNTNDWIINLTGFSSSITSVGYINASIVYEDQTYSISISVARVVNPVMVAKGTWSGIGYTGNCLQRDIVKYSGAWYAAKITVGTTSTVWTASEWEALNSFSNVATDSLFAELANVGGFIFKNGQLISQTGTIGGVVSTDYANASFVPNIILNGINGTGKFSGELSGVEGTFTELTATDGDSHTTIKGNGSTFQGDIYHQGYDYINSRSYRFYTSALWCRGVFGAYTRAAVVVVGSNARYYTKGLSDDSYVSVTLANHSDGSGNTYFTLPLYGTVDDSAGFPADLVIFRSMSGTFRYDITAIKGKKATMINANDNNNEVYFGYNGAWTQFDGGSVRDIFFMDDLLYPAQTSGQIGYGVLVGSTNDNDW